MQRKDEIVRDFLHNQLNRNDVSSEDKNAFKYLLSFLDKERENSENHWTSFVNQMKSRLNEWQINHAVEGFSYEFNKLETDSLCNFTLNLNGNRYSTWIFEVVVFMRPQLEIYFSSIQDGVEDIELSSLHEVNDLVTKTLNSSDYKEMVTEIKKQFT